MKVSRMSRQWTDAEITYLIDEYHAGRHRMGLAARFGCSVNEIANKIVELRKQRLLPAAEPVRPPDGGYGEQAFSRAMVRAGYSRTA